MSDAVSATLLLVRHGQIEANTARVWHGSTDSPLTDHGHHEARRTAEFLSRTRPRARALYTSPLLRTRQTAAEIAESLGLEPIVEASLAEYGIGELEGVSYQALLEEHRFFTRIAENRDYAPPGGESPNAVMARVTAALGRIARAHRGDEVVVVSHGAALGLALGQLIDRDPMRWQRYHLANCGLSELVLEPEPKLLAWNQTDHL
ncbi:MAG: histidine phosphatase family protein [Myxococcota bacterium]